MGVGIGCALDVGVGVGERREFPIISLPLGKVKQRLVGLVNFYLLTGPDW